MKAYSKKHTGKIVQFDFKKGSRIAERKKPQGLILTHFVEGVEAMAGRTFKDLHTLLALCALDLAEAEARTGVESYWDRAMELTQLIQSMTEFLDEAKFYFK